jgi:hypothetical protein
MIMAAKTNTIEINEFQPETIHVRSIMYVINSDAMLTNPNKTPNRKITGKFIGSLMFKYSRGQEFGLFAKINPHP